MAQWLRPFAPLREDPYLVSNTHKTAHNSVAHVVPRDPTSLGFQGHFMYLVHIYACRQNTHIYKLLLTVF